MLLHLKWKNLFGGGTVFHSLSLAGPLVAPPVAEDCCSRPEHGGIDAKTVQERLVRLNSGKEQAVPAEEYLKTAGINDDIERVHLQFTLSTLEDDSPPPPPPPTTPPPSIAGPVEDAYLSLANFSSPNRTFDDGRTRMGGRKHAFTEAFYDHSTRTFTGKLDYGDLTLQGVKVKYYTMIFGKGQLLRTFRAL